MVETAILWLRRMHPGIACTWWKTGRVRQVDLVADNGQIRIGFRFCSSLLPRAKDWWGLHSAVRDRVIDRGFVLYRGRRAFLVDRSVQAMPFDAWIRDPGAAWGRAAMDQTNALAVEALRRAV